MSTIEQWKHECLESANKVTEMGQKDDIVICLWSHASPIRNPLFNLITGTTTDLENYWCKFYPQHVKHPKSGAQILLVSMPNSFLRGSFINEIKQGLEQLLVQLERARVKLNIHIWVHDISQTVLLTHGRPDGWDTLMKIFEGSSKVEMDTVTFLSTSWESVSSEEGQNLEMEIQEMLRDEVGQGLLFERLDGFKEDEAWKIIQNVVESSSDEGKKIRREHGGERQRILTERVNQRAEDRRVRQLQRELDALYAELNRTEYGREICAKFRKVGEDQKRAMEPLVERMDSEDLKPLEKEQLAKAIEVEYLLFLREFRGYFAEMRAMRVEIGLSLRDFYGLLEPKRNKLLGLF